MFQRLEFSVIFLVCVVLCGCGTRNVDEVTSADSKSADSSVTGAGSVTQDDAAAAAAAADRLSEWVTSDDEAGQKDALVPAAGEETDAAIAGDEGDLEQGPSFDEYLSRLDDLVGGGDFSAAVEVAEEAYAKLNDDPRATQLLVSLSVLMVQQGDTDGALDVLEKLRETSDNQHIAPLLFQIYHLKSRNATDDVTALEYIQKSTEILRMLDLDQPRIADVFYSEAVLLGKNQQGEQAVAVLREAFERGYAEITKAEEEEAFAGNEAAVKLLQEFSVPIRERLREEARSQIADSETFPFGFELTAVDGETIISTEELKGKVVIVDFWGTWCPPCREEIPHFLKLKENYGADLEIVGVNFEHGGTEEEKKALVNEFIAANGVTYPCVLAEESVQEQVPKIEGFPTTIFMDKDGTVRLKVVGYHSYDKLEAIVRELMGDEPAA